MSVRQTALALLLALEERGGFANLLLSDAVIDRAGEDAPLLTALFYGTVERRLTLDYAIGVLAARDTESLSPHTRNLLRLGLYQIYFTRIPPHAATDKTVSMGENKGERGAPPFGQALLSSLYRAPFPFAVREGGNGGAPFCL